MADHDPESFRTLVDYCTTLVDRVRDESFSVGENRFDTGYFNVEDPSLTDRQRTLRAARTKQAQKGFEDAVLTPVV